MVYVYVLKLSEGKVYVGSSDAPSERIETHLFGSGVTWTSLYKPVGILQVIYDSGDVERYTKYYMRKYGIDSVRGGSFSGLFLSEDQKDIIRRELRASDNRCLLCGSSFHSQDSCCSPFMVDANGIPNEPLNGQQLGCGDELRVGSCSTGFFANTPKSIGSQTRTLCAVPELDSRLMTPGVQQHDCFGGGTTYVSEPPSMLQKRPAHIEDFLIKEATGYHAQTGRSYLENSSNENAVPSSLNGAPSRDMKLPNPCCMDAPALSVQNIAPVNGHYSAMHNLGSPCNFGLMDGQRSSLEPFSNFGNSNIGKKAKYC